MSLDDLRNGIVYSMQMNHGTIDSSGQNPAGVNNGATPITTGQKLGTGAYSFDGSNDYITTPINSGFTNQQTISIWVKAPSTVSDYAGIIVSRGINTQLAGINFLQDGQIMYNIRDPTGIESTGVNLKDNQWHLITATYNGTKMVLYVDGVYNNELSKTETIETGDYYKIGADDAFSNSYFKGIIDNVNIWNRALSSTEVTELYNSGDGLELFPGVADGVVSAYKFDGDATDSAPSGNDGTVNGATLITTGQKLGSGAYYFDGNDDEITFPIGLQNIFAGTNHYTYSVWLNINSMTHQMIIDFTSNTSGDWTNCPLWVFLLYDGNIEITRANGSECDNFTTDDSVITETNKWYHFVLTYDGSNMKLYINNSLVLTVESTLSASTASAYRGIGVYRGEGLVGFYFNGMMDDVNFWNRALSNKEIAKLYNKGNGLQYDFIIEEVSGYLIKRYNGTSWEEYPVKVYNGTDWVDAKVKRYNGSEWVEL